MARSARACILSTGMAADLFMSVSVGVGRLDGNTQVIERNLPNSFAPTATV
jgi:hypothetical protein